MWTVWGLKPTVTGTYFRCVLDVDGLAEKVGRKARVFWRARR